MFCIVQSSPGFSFGRDFFLETVHRRILLPYYKALMNAAEPIEERSSLRLECLLSYLFGPLNLRAVADRNSLAMITSICNLNRHGRMISHE